jgi:predicted nucleic acid-binding protein
MHKKRVVVNSTPIIALHGIGRLDVLKALYSEVVIPEAVRYEVTFKDSSSISDYDWIKVMPIANSTAKETFISALHDGEVEVMILAKELNSDLVIIDDGLARRHAKYLGLTLTGTIGVLLRAKENGLIDMLKPVLDDLLKHGFYISDDVCIEALRLANEL